MYRGTTPTHIFTLPFNVEQLKKVEITYEQLGQIILQKTETDCTLEGKIIRLELTQEESRLFQPAQPVSIQLRVKTNEEKVLASEIKKIIPKSCLDEDEI